MVFRVAQISLKTVIFLINATEPYESHESRNVSAFKSATAHILTVMHNKSRPK